MGDNIKIDWDEAKLKEFKERLALLKKSKATWMMGQALRKAVEFIKVELSDYTPVRTGKLRAATSAGKFSARATEAEGYVWFRRKGGYQAHLIEYGHKKVVLKGRGLFGGKKKVVVGMQPAQPYFRPTIERNQNHILEVFRYTLEQLLLGKGL